MSSVTDRPVQDEELDSTNTNTRLENIEEPGPPNVNQLNTETKTSALNLQASTSNFVSPHEFRGFPKAVDRKSSSTRKPRKKGKSTIITNTPEMEEMKKNPRSTKKKILPRIREETKKNLKELGDMGMQSPTKKPNRKNISLKDDYCDTDSDISDNIELQDSSGDENYIEEEDQMVEDESDLEINSDDFVLVEYIKGVFYVAKIISSCQNDNEYEVSYLRKCNKLAGSFRYPEIPDLGLVSKSQVTMVLPRPNQITNKRLAAYYKFNVQFENLNIR